MRFSVIIPAHNEERYISKCLDSIAEAAKPFPGNVEIIVSLNRCTDQTEQVAAARGARIVKDDRRVISAVRNTAARAANGEIIVTLDADDCMSPNMLQEVDRLLSTGKYIGGGSHIRPERLSLGIVVTGLVTAPFVMIHRVSCKLFWCFRDDYWAIGGFDETLFTVEDIDFAKRLRAYGKSKGKRFKTITRAHVIVSTRKFDELGDWHFLRSPRRLFALLGGRDRKAADDYYYNVKR